MNPITLLKRFFLLRLAFKLLRIGHEYSTTNAVEEAAAMWAATERAKPAPIEGSR